MNLTVEPHNHSPSVFVPTNQEQYENLQTNLLREEIQTHHFEDFINTVGLDVLMSIPVVDAKSLMLHLGTKHHECAAKPNMMFGKTAVRGIDFFNRPFIAINVKLMDSRSGELVTHFVEVIFRDQLNKKSTILVEDS